MGVFQGVLEIHRRQKDENEGLQKSNQQAQTHEGNGNPDSDQCEKGRHHLMVPGHVTEQPNGKRKGAHQMTDQFDRKNQGREPPNGSHEFLDVRKSMGFDP